MHVAVDRCRTELPHFQYSYAVSAQNRRVWNFTVASPCSSNEPAVTNYRQTGAGNEKRSTRDQPCVKAKRRGMCRVSVLGRLVGPPPSVRGMRTHRRLGQ